MAIGGLAAHASPRESTPSERSHIDFGTVSENPNVKPRSKLERTLDDFRPLAQLVLIAMPYYTIAVAFYTVHETKACESTHAIATAVPGQACTEGWTIVDALYFTTVSMSTVGYGDLTCTSGWSRAFTG